MSNGTEEKKNFASHRLMNQDRSRSQEEKQRRGPNMQQLSALVRRPEGQFEAQLLPFDIVVSAPSMDELIHELEHVLCMEYQIARRLGCTPFANLGASPALFWEIFDRAVEQGSPAETRDLELPSEVMDALAIALRSPQPPRFAFRDYAVAA